MSKTLKEINQEIQALQAEADELRRTKAPELPEPEIRLFITHNKYNFRVVMEVLNYEQIKAAQQKILDEFGHASCLPEKVREKSYFYTHNGWVVPSGGGNVMLQPERTEGFDRPFTITQIEWEAIQNGYVPKRLLAEYVRKMKIVEGLYESGRE